MSSNPRPNVDEDPETAHRFAMTFPRFSLIFAVSLILATSRIPAQQDVPPVDAGTILRDLEQLEQKQQAALQAARTTAVSQIKQAASSPTNATSLYESAIQATQFDGVRGQGAAFADWKKSKAALLRTKEMQTVLLLHLKYLALSLERKDSEKPEAFVAPSLAYAVEVAGADDLFLKQGQYIREQAAKDKDGVAVQREAVKLKDELLGKSLADSIFVKWLRLGPSLPKGEDWELTPGNIAGILEKNVRPVLREAKNPQLIDTWEFEMKVLADRITFGRLEHQADEFNTVTRPRLQFSRANDMIAIGQKNRGINEIYTMVKTYPQHADFGKWVQRLRELLQPAPAAPAAEPAGESAAEPPAA